MTANLKATTLLDLAPRPLTDRQMEVYRWIWEHTLKHGYQPSFREIVAKMGWHSPNAVNVHLVKLAKKGWIAAPTGPQQMRAIRFRFTPPGRLFCGFEPRREAAR